MSKIQTYLTLYFINIMHKKIIVLLFICMLVKTNSWAQHAILGYIYDTETNYPLENASVSVVNTSLFQKTTKTGEFSFSSNELKKNCVLKINCEGFTLKVLPIEVEVGKKTVIDSIKIKPTRKELKRRKKESRKKIKSDQKQQKGTKTKKPKTKKAKTKRVKTKKPTIQALPNTTVAVSLAESKKNIEILKKRYAKYLETTPDAITNIKLYQFIDKWIGKPYELGGGTMYGIDCSALTKKIMLNVYSFNIERDSKSQYRSRRTHKKGTSIKKLHEGDLVFFGRSISTISHVGLYLKNGYFVHSTSTKGNQGSGVKISNLKNNAYWRKKFIAAGRRINN